MADFTTFAEQVDSVDEDRLEVDEIAREAIRTFGNCPSHVHRLCPGIDGPTTAQAYRLDDGVRQPRRTEPDRAGAIQESHPRLAGHTEQGGQHPAQMLRARFHARQRCPATLVEEAMMSSVTQEQVLERVAGLGPLRNVFLVGEDDSFGGIAVWHPEIGLREVIFEKDDLALAIYKYLREAGVRRFKSWEEQREAERSEKWEGWDTCDDYRRMQRALEELTKPGKL